MSKLLVETSSAPTKVGKRWRAVLATPGKGSSGTYSEELLREQGPLALAPGAKAFLEHDPERKLRDMIGTYPDGAVYENGVGLVGELEIFSHWADFVEEVGPHGAMSIYMMGDTDAEGNVTALHADKRNGVDLVSYGGLSDTGLVQKLYESAKALDSDQKPSANSVQEKEDMDKEILDALAALKTSIDTFATAQVTEKNTEAQAKVDDAVIEAAVKEAVGSYKEKAEAVEAAELLPSQTAALLEAAENGEDVAPLIESAKKIRDEAKSALTESVDTVNGRVVEGAAAGFKTSAWKAN